MTEGNGVRPPGVLTPLSRNRFFYGKLMDTRHWELEQEYGIQSRRLVNRLGLGSGIMCGLGVRIADGGALCIAPGVAVDAWGREIVVNETVCLQHVDQPTDDCAKPVGDPVRNGDVTIWLCYHECGSEYTRLAAGDCGHLDQCVPGLLNERFALRIGAGLPSQLPGLTGDQCGSIFPARTDGPPQRQVVADLLDGPCTEPIDSCVPLATVKLDEAGVPTAVDVAYRTPLYSNEELFDLLMCLAARVEECCQHHDPPPPPPGPPRVMDTWPPLKGAGSDAEAAAFAGEGLLELAFERTMVDVDLNNPDAWLGVWQLTDDGAARLSLKRTVGASGHLFPAEGQEIAAWVVGVNPDRNPAHLAFVVMMRSAPGGGIVADDDGAALDAEFAGTGLSTDDRGLLWGMPSDGSFAATTMLGNAVLPTTPLLPSGDGSPGGDFHGIVVRAPAVDPPPPPPPPPPTAAPRLLHVWPAGAQRLDPNQGDAADEAKRFLDHPRIELVVSRAVADDASLGKLDSWLRAFTTQHDGPPIFGFNPIRANFAGAVAADDGSVTITVDLDPGAFRQQEDELLVIMLPDAAPPEAAPTGAAEPHDLLDADFTGTALSRSTVIAIFDGVRPDRVDNLGPITTEGATLSDGSPGGLVHYSFTVLSSLPRSIEKGLTMATMITPATHGGCGCGAGPGQDACDDPAGRERTRFFQGQLVGPEDFTQDQRYFSEKHRRHNRMLHGWGVVCGAGVSQAADADGHPTPFTVCVAPGYVLGPYGDEILVDRSVSFDVRRVADELSGACPPPVDPWCSPVRVDRQQGRTLYLAIRYDECPARPVATESGCGCGPECEYSRLVDGFSLGILDTLPDIYAAEASTDATGRPGVPDVAGTVGCAGSLRATGRPCPTCPTSPWVILADVVVEAGGLTIDQWRHRRFVASFGAYGFYCRDAQTVTGQVALVESQGDTAPASSTN